jgi:phenylalanyl-tRNA synthetase beta chain
VFDGASFKMWSEFPPMERDFTVELPKTEAAEKVISVALKAGKPLAKSVRVLDVYQGAQVKAGMTSLSLRVIFSEATRSLLEEETEKASQAILAAWQKELGIQLRD